MPNLQTVYLEGNPLQLEMGANYRRKIMLACPQLIQIDAPYVLPAPPPPALFFALFVFRVEVNDFDFLASFPFGLDLLKLNRVHS
jgi:protein phosphatase 1 regulatory subunit 7